MGGKTNSLTPVYKWPKEIWRNDGALNLIKGQMIPRCWLTDLKMSTMKGLEYTRHVFFTLEEKYICTVENILKSMRTILMENIRYTPTLPSNSVLKILVLAGWRKKPISSKIYNIKKCTFKFQIRVEDGLNCFGLLKTSELNAFQTWNCNVAVAFPKSESKMLLIKAWHSVQGPKFSLGSWKKITFKGTVSWIFIANFNGQRAYPIIGLGATY